MAWRRKFPKYVPVDVRIRKAEREIEKVYGKEPLEPVVIEGRKIVRSFWGESWCDHLESYSDYENRLPRGRTYARNGSIRHLKITNSAVFAYVSGSTLYEVKIEVTALPAQKWSSIKQKCSGQIGTMIELLQGKFSDSVMSVVTDKKEGLFPSPNEIKLKCTCPDHAYMCKHIAAVLYGVGARLDLEPELLFVLRGVNHQELIATDTAALTIGTKPSKSKRVDASELADVFGIELFAEIANEEIKDAPDEDAGLAAIKPTAFDSDKRNEKDSASEKSGSSRNLKTKSQNIETELGDSQERSDALRKSSVFLTMQAKLRDMPSNESRKQESKSTSKKTKSSTNESKSSGSKRRVAQESNSQPPVDAEALTKATREAAERLSAFLQSKKNKSSE